MAINYPFNRIIKNNFFGSDAVVTITGQFITEKFLQPTSPEDWDDADQWIEKLNPQVRETSYLLRHELDELSTQAIYYLIENKKRSFEEILRAAQVMREEIWKSWDEWISSEDFEGEPSDYHTGSQAEAIGPTSYRAWSFCSDPEVCLEGMPEDWLDQKIWRVSKPWTWAEIEMILCIWMIDESAVYLNLNNPYKASVWLARATRHRYLSLWLNDDSLADAKKSLASLGGHGKKAKYQPLREFVVERVNSKNYPSRRNAAISLAPEVVQMRARTSAPSSL